MGKTRFFRHDTHTHTHGTELVAHPRLSILRTQSFEEQSGSNAHRRCFARNNLPSLLFIHFFGPIHDNAMSKSQPKQGPEISFPYFVWFSRETQVGCVPNAIMLRFTQCKIVRIRGWADIVPRRGPATPAPIGNILRWTSPSQTSIHGKRCRSPRCVLMRRKHYKHSKGLL